MQFRYKLPDHLTDQALALEEFANGGAQCHARLHDGTVHSGLLISNATAIIAMRGHSDLPFPIDSIVALFQTNADRRPEERGNWEYFDVWTTLVSFAKGVADCGLTPLYGLPRKRK